ncbi:MAG: NAD(P)/FAD-dependent oxidoreductase [Cyclobacteriaceae bacterium]
MRKIIVIGGGAAGFFAAINIAQRNPDDEVVILEKTNKWLQKVKVSGGGRCNVTNQLSKPSELVGFYPRGAKKLYKSFEKFGTTDMVKWLKDHGVETQAEADLRMFPVTNSSQTIIDCFIDACKRYGVNILRNENVTELKQVSDYKWQISTTANSFLADKLVICTGASPNFWNKLGALGLKTASPVPSLFTFNIKDSRLQELAGVSFPRCLIKIAGTKLEESGPLLITHWGLSGPAILKLSARGARDLAVMSYKFEIIINFLESTTYEEARQFLTSRKEENVKKNIGNVMPDIPKRYWLSLLDYCQINPETKMGDMGKKALNKLTEELFQARFAVSGKSTFKEEFVTCGGVELSEINMETMEARRFPNLYLSGEVLNIDALTGGFNFQACWTSSWIISRSI